MSRQIRLKPRVKKRCKGLGISETQVAEALRVPDARVLAPDGWLHARRRMDCGRTLIVRYVEKWEARKRSFRAVDVWCLDHHDPGPAGN